MLGHSPHNELKNVLSKFFINQHFEFLQYIVLNRLFKVFKSLTYFSLTFSGIDTKLKMCF